MNRWVKRSTRHYPCCTTPGNPTLHYWVPGAARGWFTCAGCGAVGVCQGCLARQRRQMPAKSIVVWCVTHHATVCGKLMPIQGQREATPMGDIPTAVSPCQPDALARLPPLAPHVAAWVCLVDHAEAAMYPTDTDRNRAEPGEPGKYTQRAASSLWDAVYQVGHTLTPSERIHARAYLWLRDNTALLPTRDERAALGWALCPCTSCRYSRLTNVTRQQLVDCAPEAQRQYARVASVQLSPAFRATDDLRQARSA